MGYAAIQTQIVNHLQTIEGIASGLAQVRSGYQRAITQEQFETIFQISLEKTKPISAWLVVWEGAAASRPDSLQTLFVTHRFAIIGYKSYNTGSDAEIREIAERVLNAFSVYLTLGLHDATMNSTIVEDVTIEITNIGYHSLGPVLCSSVELALRARERRVPVQWTT